MATPVSLSGSMALALDKRRCSSLRSKKNDVDSPCGKGRGGRLRLTRYLASESDRGDLAAAEPARRIDTVLLYQVIPDRVGLLLGQYFGQFRVTVRVSEGGDDHFG